MYISANAILCLSEIKMSKFVLGKKSPVGDRVSDLQTLYSIYMLILSTSYQQPTIKHDAPQALGLDSYERMPYAVILLKTSADRIQQRDTVSSYYVAFGIHR